MDRTNRMNKDAPYQPQEPVYQQPAVEAQPSYSNQPTGEQEWQYGLFDCFSGTDNLCMLDLFSLIWTRPDFLQVSKPHSVPASSTERFHTECEIKLWKAIIAAT